MKPATTYIPLPRDEVHDLLVSVVRVDDVQTLRLSGSIAAGHELKHVCAQVSHAWLDSNDLTRKQLAAIILAIRSRISTKTFTDLDQARREEAKP